MRSSLVRSLSLSLLVASSGLASAACSGSSSPTTPTNPDSDVVQSDMPRDAHPDVASSDLSKLVSDNTTFAFDLYHAVAPTSTSPNLFYSPYSISLALSMTYNGAASTTATQIASALQFNQPIATLDKAFDQLDLHLESLGTGAAPSKTHPFHLNLADSTWGDKTFHFLPGYLDTLSVDYGSNVHVVDFETDPQAALTAINDWVSTETDKKIPNLLPAGSIDPSTRFVLVNAIYFDAAWVTPFNASATSSQPFTLLDGSKVTVPLMSGEFDSANYVSTKSYQAIELPYDGNETSMVVVVPNEGQFASVETGLDTAFYQGVTSSMKPATVNLSLPKFTIQGATISLKEELTKLGMPQAFTQDANFTAMTTEPVQIDDVLHQAFVSVDENGTQAAAATAVIGVGAAAPIDPVNMTVNHPFFFFVRDISTNTILFAGKVTNPS